MSQSTLPLENKKFDFNDIPDQSGKTFLITGANRGLGFFASRELANKNALVIMTCRNITQGDQAKKEILETNASAKIDVMKLDLGSLSSIQEFSNLFKQNYSQLDVLLNNAAGTGRADIAPSAKTDDGFEYRFGVNHLGTFALTGNLFDLLKKSNNSRIVTVSSNAHIRGKIPFDDLQKKGSKMSLYARSKLANILFAYELSRQIQAHNLPLLSIACHPGFSRTNIQHGGFFYKFGRKFLSQSAEKGTLPLIYACTGPDVQNGDYIGPEGFYGMKGYPKRVLSSKRSYNEHDAKKLWKISEDLTKVKFNF